MTDYKTIEQQAAERYPYRKWEDTFSQFAYDQDCKTVDRERAAYIAGRTASANEKGKLIKGEYISGWIKWGNGGYPKKSGLHNVILREKGESWVAWWNTHKKRFEEAVPEFSDKGVDVDYWQPLPAPLTGGEVSEGQGEEIKEGQQYILDKGYNSENVVTVVKVYGKHYCSVTDGSSDQWDTMCYRLSPMESQLSEGAAKGGEEHNAVHIGIAEDCRLNSVTGEYEFTRASSQEAKGGEGKP